MAFEMYIRDRTGHFADELNAAHQRVDTLAEAPELWRLKSPAQGRVMARASSLVAVIEWCDSWQETIEDSKRLLEDLASQCASLIQEEMSQRENEIESRQRRMEGLASTAEAAALVASASAAAQMVDVAGTLVDSVGQALERARRHAVGEIRSHLRRRTWRRRFMRWWWVSLLAAVAFFWWAVETAVDELTQGSLEDLAPSGSFRWFVLSLIVLAVYKVMESLLDPWVERHYVTGLIKVLRDEIDVLSRGLSVMGLLESISTNRAAAAGLPRPAGPFTGRIYRDPEAGELAEARLCNAMAQIAAKSRLLQGVSVTKAVAEEWLALLDQQSALLHEYRQRFPDSDRQAESRDATTTRAWFQAFLTQEADELNALRGR